MADAPIPFKQLTRQVGTRDALADVPDVALTKTVFLAGREPIVEQRSLGVARDAFSSDDRYPVFQLDLELPRAAIGVHAFAPSIEGTKLATRRKRFLEDDYPDVLTGFLPDHLAMATAPQRLDKRLSIRKRIDAAGLFADPEQRWATTIFPPDNRYTFNDTSFPWCTTGRVETAGGIASGTMIGPRHLLTCAHAIDWINPPNPYVAGWIKFTPSYFDGSEPFGVAWATHIYWQQQVAGPGIDSTEARNDYVVVVLDRRMGDLTGWMGSRTYSDSWDGGSYWSHIGYPGDLASASRPSFQGSFSMDGDDTEPATNQAIYHTADVWPGQSGGPMFGWWSGEPWPRVVATQSWQNSTTNGASGGSNMVDLIIRARNEHP
jgi:V8-like Glu-specific endopeptidase